MFFVIGAVCVLCQDWACIIASDHTPGAVGKNAELLPALPLAHLPRLADTRLPLSGTPASDLLQALVGLSLPNNGGGRNRERVCRNDTQDFTKQVLGQPSFSPVFFFGFVFSFYRFVCTQIREAVDFRRVLLAEQSKPIVERGETAIM